MRTGKSCIAIHSFHKIDTLLAIVKNHQLEFQAGLLKRFTDQKDVRFRIFD